MLDWFRTDPDAPPEGAADPAPGEEPAGPPETTDPAAATPGRPRSPGTSEPTAETGPAAERPGDPGEVTTERAAETGPTASLDAPIDRREDPVVDAPPPVAPGMRPPGTDRAEPATFDEPEPERSAPDVLARGGPTTDAPTETTRTTASVICIANQKGGVGKTTTAVSLAAALAEAGAQVLLVDLDPQGNATTGLGLRPQEGAPSTYRVLIEEMPVEDATEPTSVRGLHCVPSSLDLAGAEIELVSVFNRERRLRQGLDPVRDLYDVILIDCPPTLGLLTVNALAAADQVILPIQCEYYALEGVGQLTRTVDLVRRGLNPDLDIGGVVLTMYDARTKLSEQVADEVRAHFEARVFRTIIPRTVRLSEAPSYGQPITVYDPSSRGARAYLRLADELAQRLGLDLETTSPLDDLLGSAPRVSDDADAAAPADLESQDGEGDADEHVAEQHAAEQHPAEEHGTDEHRYREERWG